MKKATALSLLFILFTSAAIKGTKLSQNYSSSEHKFQISYPKGWKADESKGKDNVLLIGPIIDTVTKQPDGTVSIKARLNDKVISTSQVYSNSMTTHETIYKDFKRVEEGEMLLGEVKCKYVVCKYSAQPSKTETSSVSSVQFYFSNGKTSFVFEGTTPGETLGKNKELYFDIAKSIKFSKK